MGCREGKEIHEHNANTICAHLNVFYIYLYLSIDLSLCISLHFAPSLSTNKLHEVVARLAALCVAQGHAHLTRVLCWLSDNYLCILRHRSPPLISPLISTPAVHSAYRYDKAVVTLKEETKECAWVPMMGMPKI